MKLRHKFWQNSQCKKRYLHRLEIIREFPEGVTEACKICHKKFHFKIVNGRLDHNRYMSYHLRQVLGNIPIPNYIEHEYKYDPTV